MGVNSSFHHHLAFRLEYLEDIFENVNPGMPNLACTMGAEVVVAAHSVLVLGRKILKADLLFDRAS